MNATQIGQLMMPDRRHVKDHIEDFCKEVADQAVVLRAAGRQVTDKQFVGTFINDPGEQCLTLTSVKYTQGHL